MTATANSDYRILELINEHGEKATAAMAAGSVTEHETDLLDAYFAKDPYSPGPITELIEQAFAGGRIADPHAFAILTNPVLRLAYLEQMAR